MNEMDLLLRSQLDVVADHCEETGLRSGAGAVRTAMARLEQLSALVETARVLREQLEAFDAAHARWEARK